MTMATTDSDSAKHYAELFVGMIPPLSSTIQLCMYLPHYRREYVSFVFEIGVCIFICVVLLFETLS